MIDRAPLPIFTIGHSTRSLDEFLSLLDEFEVDCVLDVRRHPGSRAFPQYDSEALRESLTQAGVEYRHLAALGGRRSGHAKRSESNNTLWTNASFRRYADYAESEEFHEGLAELETLAREQRCALMCAEAVWWRCHRRIIADFLLARSYEVRHIMGPGKALSATLTPGAKVAASGVDYPAPDDCDTSAIAHQRTSS